MPKKKQAAEFRFYELPLDEPALALTGSKWIQVYGENIDKQHFHNLMEIGYCHYGSGDLAFEEERHRFDADMISCIPANYLHVTKSDTDVMAFWEYLFISPEEILHRQGRMPQEIQALREIVNRRAFFFRAEENPAIAMLVRAIFQEMKQKGAYYRNCVEGLVYALLFEIARVNGKEPDAAAGKTNTMQLEQAIAYVEENYRRNFRIADLADECHMSETHFRRVFQEKMNMTPIEYVNFVRIKKACELIDRTDISMEEVAEQVGFVTPSTFNRNFRRIIGTSPYQWKKRPDNHAGKLLDYRISALKGW